MARVALLPRTNTELAGRELDVIKVNRGVSDNGPLLLERRVRRCWAGWVTCTCESWPGDHCIGCSPLIREYDCGFFYQHASTSNMLRQARIPRRPQSPLGRPLGSRSQNPHPTSRPPRQRRIPRIQTRETRPLQSRPPLRSQPWLL